MSEHPRELNFSRLVLLSAVTLLVAINAGATVFAQPFVGDWGYSGLAVTVQYQLGTAWPCPPQDLSQT